MQINPIAAEQYKELCQLSWSKCHGDEKLLCHKIQRAVQLGEVIHDFQNGFKTVRYHYLNFFVDNDEVIMMWRDTLSKPFHVTEDDKCLYDEVVLQKKYSPKLLKLVTMITS